MMKFTANRHATRASPGSAPLGPTKVVPPAYNDKERALLIVTLKGGKNEVTLDLDRKTKRADLLNYVRVEPDRVGTPPRTLPQPRAQLENVHARHAYGTLVARVLAVDRLGAP
jgi:hypothetical protein